MKITKDLKLELISQLIDIDSAKELEILAISILKDHLRYLTGEALDEYPEKLKINLENHIFFKRTKTQNESSS
jgi:REP element-mobilizing transposase RayT